MVTTVTKPGAVHAMPFTLTDEELETVRAALMTYLQMFTREDHMYAKIRAVLERLAVSAQEPVLQGVEAFGIGEEIEPGIWWSEAA